MAKEIKYGIEARKALEEGTDESEDCYETIWTVGVVDVVELRIC